MCSQCEYGRLCDSDLPAGWTRSAAKGTLSRKLRIGAVTIFRLPGADQSLDKFAVSLSRYGVGNREPEIMSRTFDFEYDAVQAAQELIDTLEPEEIRSCATATERSKHTA